MSKSISKLLTKTFERIKKYYKMSNVEIIVRRYIVTNMFDATLTTLGIILGARIYGVVEAKVVIGACIGAAIGLGVSGVVSTYVTERAERIAEIKRLERALLADLKNSEIARAQSYAAIMTAIMSGVSPAFAVLLPTIPYLALIMGVLNGEAAFQISISTSLILLFSLGFYLGKISRQNRLLYGMITLTAGILVTMILLIAGTF